MEQEKVVIQLKNKVLTLLIKDFGDSEVNLEDLLQVDMNNIIADICTFPVLFNRIGNIKADIDEFVRQTQLDFSIFEAQLYEKHKKALLALGKATEGAIDSAVKQDPQYKTKKLETFKVQRQAEIVDSLYWSAKSKDKKLDAISAKIKPEEFEGEILQGTINSVVIRVQQNQFPNRR